MEAQKGLVKLSACPNCEQIAIQPSFSMKSAISVNDKIMLRKLSIEQVESTWELCNNCGLLFLNPRFDHITGDRLYGEEDIYRSADIEAFGSFEALAAFIDPTLNIISLDPTKTRHAKNLNFVVKTTGLKPENTILLDIGSGWGAAAPAADVLGFQYFGFDSSASCLRLAHDVGRNVSDEDLSQRDLPHDRTVLIYMSQVLEHIPNPGPWLKSIVEMVQVRRVELSWQEIYIHVDVPTWDIFSSSSLYNPHRPMDCANWGHYNHFDRVSLRNTFLLARIRPVHSKLSGGDVSGVGEIEFLENIQFPTLQSRSPGKIKAAVLAGNGVASIVDPLRSRAVKAAKFVLRRS